MSEIEKEPNIIEDIVGHPEIWPFIGAITAFAVIVGIPVAMSFCEKFSNLQTP